MGFSVWFAKMWYDDRGHEKTEESERDDPEARSGSESERASLESVGRKLDGG
jgi:hypothetical protein